MVEVDKIGFVEGKRGRSSQLPWRAVAVGESFLAPYRDGWSRDKTQSNLANLARYHWESGNYRTRQEDGGVRVYRVGEIAK